MPITVLTRSGIKPIKLWSPIHEVESSALDQLYNTASLPCIFHHMAVMPDVHYGIGATVGSVVATKGAIIPAAVGVDIGCGMIYAKLPFFAKRLPDNLEPLYNAICKAVPVGQGMHTDTKANVLDDHTFNGFAQLPKVIQDQPEKAWKQIGTLGGGNHFIEIVLDTNNQVGVMLHSGSRGIGNKIGKYYIEQAQALMKTYMIKLNDPNLAYLADGTKLFDEYWRDLQWAQRYAMQNRNTMMDLVLKAIAEVVFGDRNTVITPEYTVNCHHNYAERENHYGENVIVTRKGAVRARVGDMGIIPGSMGTRSYIVEGLGNAESFHSCSHGAGRTKSRSKAKEGMTAEKFAEETAGIMCRKDEGVFDEAPSAYKDIDQVMEYQKDLVKVNAQLHQILCIKG